MLVGAISAYNKIRIEPPKINFSNMVYAPPYSVLLQRLSPIIARVPNVMLSSLLIVSSLQNITINNDHSPNLLHTIYDTEPLSGSMSIDLEFDQESQIDQVYIEKNDFRYILKETDGTYHGDVDENGVYSIIVYSKGSKQKVSSFEITNIDNDAPVVSDISYDDEHNELHFQLEDRVSGIHLSNSYITSSDNQIPIQYDVKQNMYYALIDTNQKITIHVEDKVGNVKEVDVTLSLEY